MNLFAAFGIVIGTFALATGAVLLRGWVLTKLWAWLVVPTFGLQPLGLAAAIGLALIVGYLTKQPDYAQPKNKWQPAVDLFVGPLVALLMGYIVRSYL